MRSLAAFGCGLVFAIGLGLASMTQPAKVIGFLDVAGRWDPTLAFVMGGAVLVGLLLFPRILSRRAPLLASRFLVTERTGIDAPLVIGAALFGAGWGLSGYCPGPALVSLVTGAPPVLVFVASMAIGLYAGGFVAARERVRTRDDQLARRGTVTASGTSS